MMETTFVTSKQRRIAMKKIMSLMVGLSLVLGAAAFAQDAKDTSAKEKKASKKKAGKKAKKDTAAKDTAAK